MALAPTTGSPETTKAEAANAAPRFCIDCFYISDALADIPRCLTSAARHTDLVKGEARLPCAAARGKYGVCGPEAALFVSKTGPESAENRRGRTENEADDTASNKQGASFTAVQTKLTKALSAAKTFKYMLEIQQPGSLFYPGGKECRETNAYEQASQLLDEASAQNLNSADSPCSMLISGMPISDVVPDDGANTPTDALDLLEQARMAILNLGFELVRQDIDSSKDRCLFEFCFRRNSQGNEPLGLSKGESDIVHFSSNSHS